MTTQERLSSILKHIPNKKERPFVIAIDGRCGSGKSTLAAALSKTLDCGVIHMDDFFLPPALQTDERRAEIGGGVHYERFADEILPYLISPLPFSYRAYQCSTGTHRNVNVSGGAYFIIEGSYSHHPYFSSYADLRIFLTVERPIQLARLTQRSPEKIFDFIEKWIPAEEAYLTGFGIIQNSDLVL